MTHSILVGGSNAHRALACPASVRLSALAGPGGGSAAAHEGTALHAAMQLEIYGVPALGATVSDGEAPFEITADLHDECITPALAMVRTVIAEAGGAFACEQSMAFPGIPDAFGTADVIALDGEGRLRAVCDYKFGRRPADAAAQMAFYITCASQDFVLSPEGVRRVVIQPRVSPEPIEYPPMHGEDIAAFQLALMHAVMRAAIAEPTTGPHCRYCPALAICPAAHDDAEAVAPALPITAETYRRALRAIDWAKAVKSAAGEHMRAGGTMEGYALGYRNRREWLNEDWARGAMIEHGVEPYARALRSPAQAEEAGVDVSDLTTSVPGAATIREVLPDGRLAGGYRRMEE